MRVRFWGTRGSIPTPGAHTVRYGGNTPCVEVRLPNDELVILDAGTGIRALGDQLTADLRPVRALLAITHPHWDHVQGLPFFKPLFAVGNEITIVGPESKNFDLQQVVSRLMDKTFFPVKLDELRATIRFASLNEGTISIPGGTLSACLVNHPSLTVGYRIDAGGKSIVYISDNEPFEKSLAMNNGVDRAVVERYAQRTGDPNGHIYDFARGADILIHDSTYTPEEYQHHMGWGHSSYLFSLQVAQEAGVGKLVLFHHEHTHHDQTLDLILNNCRQWISEHRSKLECLAASEGLVIEW